MNWFKRHKVLTALALIVILGIIGTFASNSKPSNQITDTVGTSNSSSSKMSPSASAAASAKLNQPADDGKFRFTITGFACGATKITQPDNSYVTSQAQGNFCVMNLTVKNIGNVAQSFHSSNQYIYNASNNQYSYSLVASVHANPSNSRFSASENLNPGLTISGIVVFDVPKNVTPVYAILHDSGASSGVKVSLK